MGRLDEKVAVITGGAGGIGAATTMRFLREGAKVIAADINEPAGIALLESANLESDAGSNVAFMHCDVTNESSVATLIDFAVERFGRIDCLFNTAGIAPTEQPLPEADFAQWEHIFNVNLVSVLFGIKYASRAMRANTDGGTIINMASISAFSVKSGRYAYPASKGAIVNLTKTAAVDLAPLRIRVNAISPGAILTTMNPAAKATDQPWPELGAPEQVASVALFLASDDSRFVVGHNIVVDGGASLVRG